MQETYTTKDYFRPYQEDYAPLLTDLEECPDEPVYGKRWNIPLYLGTAYNVRTGAEGGDPPDVQSDSVVQGQVLNQEFKGVIRLTELLSRQGRAGTHFNGGALNHQMKQVTSDLTKHMQIMLWGHGTGRLAVVDATSGGSVTVRCRLPWAATRLRKNMRVTAYDLDTGGSRQALANIKIIAVDRTARGDSSGAGYNTYGATITLASSQAFTAGWGLYLASGATDDDYGLAPNGIDGLIGSSTLAPNFLGQSRATYPELNTNRLHNSGTPRDLTLDLMQSMADQIWVNGYEIDSIRCNAGLMLAYANLHIHDKRYTVVNGDYPKLIGGFREGDLVFAYDKIQAVIRKDPQCTARTMKFLSFKETFYKHTLAELGFLNRGGNILLPMPSANGKGYAYSITARLYGALNISNYGPLGNGSLEDLKDPTIAGD
jgi:hypothetical protein